MKKVIKVIQNLIVGFLIIILLAFLSIAVYSFIEIDIREKEYCNIFGFSFFQIETGSMAGTIEIEDIIIIKLGNENIKKGDIITFRQNGNLITHRVIEIDDEKIITKGDNNTSQDKPITKESVLGKVEKIIPEVKIWKSVFKEPKVLISLAITIVLFILVVSYKEKMGEKDV